MADTAANLFRLHHAKKTPDMPPREGRTYFLGRNIVSAEGSDTEIILCVSEFVSRHHCDIFYKSGAFWIKDRKSLNGTYLNGQKILPYTDRELRFGDIIGLGVSHEATDVNVQAPEYFIFRFQGCQYELIDLEEDSESVKQANVPHSSSSHTEGQEPVQQVSVAHASKSHSENLTLASELGQPISPVVEVVNSDDEDIQIVEEKISSPDSSPLKANNNPPSPSSSASKTKRLPPPPPPPLISKPKNVPIASTSTNKSVPVIGQITSDSVSDSASIKNTNQTSATKIQPSSVIQFVRPDNTSLSGNEVDLPEPSILLGGGLRRKPRPKSFQQGNEPNTKKQNSLASDNNNEDLEKKKQTSKSTPSPASVISVPAVTKLSSTEDSSTHLSPNCSKRFSRPEAQNSSSVSDTKSRKVRKQSPSDGSSVLSSSAYQASCNSLNHTGNNTKIAAVGTEASSGDDSSDGMSSSIIQRRKLISSPELPPVNSKSKSSALPSEIKLNNKMKGKRQDPKKSSTKVEEEVDTDDSNCKRPSEKKRRKHSSSPVPQNMQPISRPRHERLIHVIERKILKVRLRQLIVRNEKTGSLKIMYKFSEKLTDDNKQKIAEQFELSRCRLASTRKTKNVVNKPKKSRFAILQEIKRENSHKNRTRILQQLEESRLEVLEKAKLKREERKREKEKRKRENSLTSISSGSEYYYSSKSHLEKRRHPSSESCSSNEVLKKKPKTVDRTPDELANSDSKRADVVKHAENLKPDALYRQTRESELDQIHEDLNRSDGEQSRKSKNLTEIDNHIPGCSKRTECVVANTDPISDTDSHFSSHSRNEDYDQISDGDDMDTEVLSAEETVVPGPSPTPEVYLKGNRQLKVITDAPTPPEVARRRNRILVQMESERKKTSKPNVNAIKEGGSKKSMKEIKEQLKEVEKKRLQVPQDKHENESPKPKAPVRVKIQTRNRNQDLLDTMTHTMGEAGKKDSSTDNVAAAPVSEVEESIHENKTISAPKREIPVPRREIPIPSIEIQSEMPLNKIQRNQFKPNDGKKMPPPPAQTYVKDWSKPALPSHVSNSGLGKTVLNYNHKSFTPASITSGSFNQSRELERNVRQAPVVREIEDHAYRAILKWRTSWLIEQEQPNHTSAPPVTEGISYHRTALIYNDFKYYCDTFYPLILLEIWAVVSQDWSNKRKPREGYSEHGVSEFHVAVENVKLTSECPMMRQGVSVNKKDDYWAKVQCYGLVRRKGEINNKRDFCIVTLPMIAYNEKKEKVQKQRECFGMILSSDEKDVPLFDGCGAVNEELRKKCPQAAFKHTFTVVVHIPVQEKVDKSNLGTIKKISYISSKLRDVKSLNNLRFSPLHSYIQHPQPPKVPFNPTDTMHQLDLVQYASKLNLTQKAIVSYVSKTVRRDDPELLLLHGPPGTGKTKTIVGMILQILLAKESRNSSRENRILVCTPSNTAVDEILVRLEEAMRDLPQGTTINMVRVGETDGPLSKQYSLDVLARKEEDNSSTTINIRANITECENEIKHKKGEIAEIKKNSGSKTTIISLQRSLREAENRKKDYMTELTRLREEKSHNENFSSKNKVLEKANVIFSTLNSCSNSLISRAFGHLSRKKNPFLCCIVDEASQATEPETLAPLLLQVDKLILVGDPEQLGPTVISKDADKNDFGMSLFKRHHRYYLTHNKHNAIMMLTQQYRMHPEILSWPNEFFYRGLLKTRCLGRKEDDVCPLRPYLFLNLSSQEKSNQKGQISNEHETKVVIEILRTLHLTLATNEKKFSIGVITPYSTQKGEITKNLKVQLPPLAGMVKVDTVDSFQGREEDIIIISCVRTDDTGFLKNPSRLNVALTRAKYSLIVVGDAACLNKDPMWNSLIEDACKRKVKYDMAEAWWSDPGCIRKKLFNCFSPSKSQIPENERFRDWLGGT